jgi:hypothetical protein
MGQAGRFLVCYCEILLLLRYKDTGTLFTLQIALTAGSESTAPSVAVVQRNEFSKIPLSDSVTLIARPQRHGVAASTWRQYL